MSQVQITKQVVRVDETSTNINVDLNLNAGPQGLTGLQGQIGPTGPVAWSSITSWQSNTSYVVGPPASAVTYQGSTYVCTTTHTSGSSFDSSKWVQVASKGDTGTFSVSSPITVASGNVIGLDTSKVVLINPTATQTINGSLNISNSIQLGGDTSLYRSGAGTIRTDNMVYIYRPNAGDYGLYVTNTTSGFASFAIQNTGKMEWGPGTVARDTFLYRNNSNELKTDGQLTSGSISTTGNANVGGDLTIGGNLNISGTINETTTLRVTDKTITVANGAQTSSDTDGAGIIAGTWTTGTIPSILWSNYAQKWVFNKPIQGNVDTATTATSLSPGKKINNVLFDGTQDITITADANTLSATNNTLSSNVLYSSIQKLGTQAQALNMGGFGITNLPTTNYPNNSNDAVTKNYVDITYGSSASPVNHDFYINSPSNITNKIINVANPINPQDVATKYYVDSQYTSVSANKGYYGSFVSNAQQTASSTTAVYIMYFDSPNTGLESNGVTIELNTLSTPTRSRITFAFAGTYNLQFSTQFENTSNSDQDVQIWLRKNGTDVIDSNSVVNVPAKHGSVNGHTIAAWNFVFTVAAGDYYELVWQTSAPEVSIQTYTNYTGTTPSTPQAASIILTITQQMYIQTAAQTTGISSGSVLSGTAIGTNNKAIDVTSISNGLQISGTSPNQTVTVKSVTGGGISVASGGVSIDTTKVPTISTNASNYTVSFSATNLAANSTLTVPAIAGNSGDIVTTAGTQTLTAKTLTSPLISGSSTTVTLTSAQTTASKTLTIPQIPNNDIIATLGLSNTFTGTNTFTSPSINTSITSSSSPFTAFSGPSIFDIGAGATTGTFGYNGTATSITNLSTGVVASGNTKTVSIGTSGVSGSTTNINIGPQAGTPNINIYSGSSNSAMTFGYAGGFPTINVASSLVTSNINMLNTKVTGLGTPTATGDAVTKNYADLSFGAFHINDNVTIPRIMATNSVTPATSGTVYGVRFVPLVGGTKAWTALFAIASTIGSGATVYAGLWDSSGTLLQQSSAATLGGTGSSTAAFSSFALTAGTTYYLGLGIKWSTTAPNIAGLTVINNVNFISPIMGAPGANTTWASGSTLPGLSTLSGTTFLPWIELY